MSAPWRESWQILDPDHVKARRVDPITQAENLAHIPKPGNLLPWSSAPEIDDASPLLEEKNKNHKHIMHPSTTSSDYDIPC